MVTRSTGRSMEHGHSAFTLVEMLVTVAVLSMVAVMVTPMFSDDSRLRVMAAADIVASDIELAQVMTISLPSDPVVVRFDPDNASYWLAFAADPDTPILRENTGEPYFITFGTGRASSAFGVTMTVEAMTQNTLVFDSTGALTDFSTTPLIHLTCGPNSITLMIKPMTGSIVELDDAPDEEPPKE